ncbi:lysosomal acid glucosylceramidase-like [Linepithema humile]|uniref:lysosomal acid glucosylceramidase-like n=1 Tax=Linepithema humile TaxID=83485 RepID=UPI0006230B90|nr:PREDICTED: glucosylceramidase-like [Linepithema humile]
MLRSVILFITFVIVQSNKCAHRSFGQDSIVCVCNATYCDRIYQSRLQAGQFQLYTSSKSGERLQFTTGNFSTKPVNGTLLIINSTQQYQKVHGFGGAFTDSSVLNIRSLSNRTRRKLLESYFAAPGNGIGYTYINVPIAGTDFATRPYSYDDTPHDSALRNFSLVNEDNYRIEYLHEIKNIMSNSNNLRLLCSSWAAPAWMKTSNETTWGILKREYYQTYANYLKKYFDAYKKHNISFWGFIPAHEPLAGFDTNNWYNGMGWSPNASAFWAVNYLAPTLKRAGYNPAYIAYDDERANILSYVEDVFRNKKANKLYTGISVHWYLDPIVSPMILTETHNRFPDKFLLITEVFNGVPGYQTDVGVLLGLWSRGESYAADIIQNFQHSLNAYVDFNLVLNEHGGPNWSGKFADAAIIVAPEHDEFYKQPNYYAMAHFSSFVPRNSRRISSTGLENNQNVSAVAFLTPEEKIVVVTINKGDKPINITLKHNNTGHIINLYLSAHSLYTVLYHNRR